MWLRRLTVAVLASSHNVKALDPIDKVTVVTLKVCDNSVDIKSFIIRPFPS